MRDVLNEMEAAKMALDIFDGICRHGFWQNERCPEIITHFLKSDGWGFCSKHRADHMFEISPTDAQAVVVAYDSQKSKVTHLRTEQAKRRILELVSARRITEEDLGYLNLQGHIIRCDPSE